MISTPGILYVTHRCLRDALGIPESTRIEQCTIPVDVADVVVFKVSSPHCPEVAEGSELPTVTIDTLRGECA